MLKPGIKTSEAGAVVAAGTVITLGVQEVLKPDFIVNWPKASVLISAFLVLGLVALRYGDNRALVKAKALEVKTKDPV